MTVSRRAFLRTVAFASGVAFPLPLRAQPKTVKIGGVFPVSGPLAEVGQDCRAGAQLAVDLINAAGGIKSMGGVRLELITGDSQTRPDVARSEAERLITSGAQVMTGGFHSAHVATIAPLAQQRRVPYVIDITAADSITASIAKSVREGQQKVQYVYRNFPSSVTFSRNAVRYMKDVFATSGIPAKRVVVMYTNDLFGKTVADAFQATHKAMNPGFEIVQVIPYPENAVDLSTEVSLARAAKPDVIAPLTRPATAIILLEELARQRVDLMGIISPGAPGLYEVRQIEQLKQRIEHVMDCVPWPNHKSPEVQRVAAEYAKRTGKLMDTSASFTYEAVQVIADTLERAKSAEPDVFVEAIRQTSFTHGINIGTGPIRFNETGDNPNATTAVIQILGGKPRVVWPKENAEQPFVFPRPKAG
jgi:branched-chain amino acid transport system substrate-binding protein